MSERRTVVSRGELLCAIGNAGKHLWTMRGSDLFFYEYAFAAIRVTTRETVAAQRPLRERRSFESYDTAHGKRLRAKGDRPFEELSDQRPANRVVEAAAIAKASLRRRRVGTQLTLSLTDGDTLPWVWTSPPNPPFEEVEEALRQMLGSRLRVQ